MKRVLTVLWFLMAVPAYGQTIVQSNAVTNNAAHTSLTVPFTSNPTAGDLIDVMVQVNSTTVTITAADTCANTFMQIISQNSNDNTQREVRFYAKNIAGCGADSVTLTYSASVPFSRVLISEISGLDTTSPLDQSISSNGAGVSLSVPSVTTTAASEILIACGNTSVTSTGTAGTGYTIYLSQSAFCEDQVVSTTGNYAATATESMTGNWIMTLASYKVSG